ncbi:MAG TPA: hypothetical protein VK658_01640, partial [Chryseolinea sp.]|nr:hypothetical protein [Chryseolinea sp.]
MKRYLPVLLLALFSHAGFCQQNIASFREITATQALGDRIFFAANHDQYGTELFVSNGDSKSVTLLKDIATGYQGSGPTQLTVFNNQIFFIAYTREFGGSVWKTDGTPQGTQLVYGVQNAEPFNLMVFKDKLYFTTNLGSIMRTDGTEAGTEVSYQSPSNYGRVQIMIKDDHYFYFTFDTRTIFRDDGTTRISFLGPLSWEDVYFRNFFSLGDKLVVIKAGSSDHIIRIYAIDNSVVHDQGEDEWTLIKKLDAPNYYGSQYLANFTIIGTKLNFRYRKSYENEKPGDELWSCDGTEEGTKMIKAFEWTPYGPNADISKFFVYDGKLIFEAGEYEKKALWSS